MEDILEKDFGDDYAKIDGVLDRIPENHHKTVVKAMVQTTQSKIFGGRRGSNTSYISNLNENSLLMKKLFSSQIGSRGSNSNISGFDQCSPKFQIFTQESNFKAKLNNVISQKQNSRSLSAMAMMYSSQGQQMVTHPLLVSKSKIQAFQSPTAAKSKIPRELFKQG